MYNHAFPKTNRGQLKQHEEKIRCLFTHYILFKKILYLMNLFKSPRKKIVGKWRNFIVAFN